MVELGSMLMRLGEFIHVDWKSVVVGARIFITSKVGTFACWGFGGEVVFCN